MTAVPFATAVTVPFATEATVLLLLSQLTDCSAPGLGSTVAPKAAVAPTSRLSGASAPVRVTPVGAS